MKKMFAILLMMMYGFSSTGMTLHLHYCCGKLDKIDFSPVKENRCGAGSHMAMNKKSCCDNKQVSFKIISDQNPVKFIAANFQMMAVKNLQPQFFVTSPILTKKILPEVFAPPPLQKDIATLFCIYRI